MSHPIPSAALDDRLGFIGTSGSGKTYNAGGAVERLLEKKARVVIIDPLGVWWGLRLTADGKHPSDFNVVIFGGPHGDLPLTEHTGALIGETAASMVESCIVDLSEMRGHAAERRFMTAFLETLYRKASGEPFHLIVDEADLFAPQKPYSGDETLLGHMENIVRRGRVKGFISWLISQRPAVLNKNVLSQVDGLIAFKLTATQDRDALDAWIEGQADKAQGKEIKDTLPTRQVGEGVVWLPSYGVLKTVQFPPKVTFDSSRAPKRGERAKKVKTLKPLNLGALKERLAGVEAEAKANDPRALHSQIAALKTEKAKLEKQIATVNPVADKDAIKAAEERGFDQAKKKLTAASERAVRKKIGELLDKLEQDVAKVMNAAALFRGELAENIRDLRKERADLDDVVFQPSTPQQSGAQLAQQTRPPVQQRSAMTQPRNEDTSGGSYTRPQMRVLRSLAMWKSIGHEAPSREMVAAGAGYSPGSGGFNNLIGGLSTAGAIAIPQPGRLALMLDNIEVPSVDDGRESLLSILSNPHRKLVTALNGAGAMTRDALAQAAGYAPGSGGFNNLIGKLNTLGISFVPSQGHVALSEWTQKLLNGYEMRIVS